LGDLYLLYEKLLIENNRLQIEFQRTNEKRLTAEAMGTVLYSFGQLIKNSHDTIRDQLDILKKVTKAEHARLDDKELASMLEIIGRAMETVDTIFQELKLSAESKAFLGSQPLHIIEIHHKIKARLARFGADS
jgi:hypothetical protein